jgi:ornithine cyclodeaminase/alanine dehydrogenase-like protein (mu-crystallin family)
MTTKLGVEVRAVERAEDAVRDADIIVAATNAREPVLRGEWLAPGAHVNAIGANRVQAREMDDEVLNRSAFVCVDSIEQAKIEAGDFVIPANAGVFAWERVRELGEVVAGKLAGRANREDMTLFKSLGVALEDVAVGAWVYEQAREQKIGQVINL